MQNNTSNSADIKFSCLPLGRLAYLSEESGIFLPYYLLYLYQSLFSF